MSRGPPHPRLPGGRDDGGPREGRGPGQGRSLASGRRWRSGSRSVVRCRRSGCRRVSLPAPTNVPEAC
ncbi:hypothetical protein B5180_21405 [Streptomyces sp. BF-3]|nr:hypothetical protein B5180_21405 [Streptomyces sp. BF-3]